MSQDPVNTVIDALLKARGAHRPVNASALDNVLSTAQQAYAVQAGVAERMGWFSARKPMHWKSGGPSRQAALTHAPLPPGGVWASPAAAGEFLFNLRYIEAEVALRLGGDVDQAMADSLDEASASTLIDAMAVSIEIVDSRWAEAMSASALLKLADLQSHGALILGEWAPWIPVDWTQQTCRVSIGQQPVVERQGTHPLGNPVWGISQWLRHATQNANTVPAGTVVTTGSWVGMLDAQANDRVRVEFDGIGVAQVQL